MKPSRRHFPPMIFHSVPPPVVNEAVIGGAAQPLVDVAATLSLQGHRHHAQTLAEVAWVMERIAKMPEVIAALETLRADPEARRLACPTCGHYSFATD